MCDHKNKFKKQPNSNRVKYLTIIHTTKGHPQTQQQNINRLFYILITVYHRCMDIFVVTTTNSIQHSYIVQLHCNITTIAIWKNYFLQIVEENIIFLHTLLPLFGDFFMVVDDIHVIFVIDPWLSTDHHLKYGHIIWTIFLIVDFDFDFFDNKLYSF